MEFSPHVRVAFCRPLEEVFKLKCKGARTLARVIGSVDRQSEGKIFFEILEITNISFSELQSVGPEKLKEEEAKRIQRVKN